MNVIAGTLRNSRQTAGLSAALIHQSETKLSRRFGEPPPDGEYERKRDQYSYRDQHERKRHAQRVADEAVEIGAIAPEPIVPV